MQTLNSLPCGQCAFFDGTTMPRPGKTSRLGWCAATSVYPAEDPVGRPAPRGVKRAAPGELPKPVVVTRQQVLPGCNKAAPASAPEAITRANLLAKVRGR